MPCQQMLLQAPETGPDDDCQYEYGVKEIAFCLMPLQLAGNTSSVSGNQELIMLKNHGSLRV